MASTKTSRKPVSKEAWAKANDAGPHLATLPSGNIVRFRIPDSGALLREGRLPEGLRDTALLFGSHPEGPEELMRELVITASLRESAEKALTRLIRTGKELEPHLVAAMLVEPEVTAEEVASGMFHELDVRMLLEFAERLRNVDAAGNRLPIITLDEWATFRREPERGEGSGSGGANGDDPAGVLPDAGDGDV